MNVLINVKGISNRQNKIKHVTYEYSEQQMTLREFLTETVRITVRDYNKRLEARVKKKGREDDYDVSEDSMELMKCLSNREIEQQADTGKVAFGMIYNDKKADEQQAVANAIQCFLDGMVAVFVDDVRMEYLDETVNLTESSTVTFIRLTFLAGRMW